MTEIVTNYYGGYSLPPEQTRSVIHKISGWEPSAKGGDGFVGVDRVGDARTNMSIEDAERLRDALNAAIVRARA